MKHWTKADSARVDDLKAKGLSWVAIGKELGTSEASCRRHWERKQAKAKAQAAPSTKPKAPHRYAVSSGPLDPNLTDKSTPRFAEHTEHLKLIHKAKPHGFTWASPWLVHQLGKAERGIGRAA